ncbi:unnamed protein product [Gadus morhua 'NCC']
MELTAMKLISVAQQLIDRANALAPLIRTPLCRVSFPNVTASDLQWGAHLSTDTTDTHISSLEPVVRNYLAVSEDLRWGDTAKGDWGGGGGGGAGGGGGGAAGRAGDDEGEDTGNSQPGTVDGEGEKPASLGICGGKVAGYGPDSTRPNRDRTGLDECQERTRTGTSLNPNQTGAQIGTGPGPEGSGPNLTRPDYPRPL